MCGASPRLPVSFSTTSTKSREGLSVRICVMSSDQGVIGAAYMEPEKCDKKHAANLGGPPACPRPTVSMQLTTVRLRPRLNTYSSGPVIRPLVPPTMPSCALGSWCQKGERSDGVVKDPHGRTCTRTHTPGESYRAAAAPCCCCVGSRRGPGRRSTRHVASWSTPTRSGRPQPGHKRSGLECAGNMSGVCCETTISVNGGSRVDVPAQHRTELAAAPVLAGKQDIGAVTSAEAQRVQRPALQQALAVGSRELCD